jgi:hypothetical protein
MDGVSKILFSHFYFFLTLPLNNKGRVREGFKKQQIDL